MTHVTRNNNQLTLTTHISITTFKRIKQLGQSPSWDNIQSQDAGITATFKRHLTINLPIYATTSAPIYMHAVCLFNPPLLV